MKKILLIIAIYLFGLTIYINTISNKNFQTEIIMMSNKNLNNIGSIENANIQQIVFCDVYRDYLGYSLPLYIGNYDIRILHNIIFYFIPFGILMYGVFLYRKTMEVNKKWKRRTKTKKEIYGNMV